jgi:hypothetical protein
MAKNLYNYNKKDFLISHLSIIKRIMTNVRGWSRQGKIRSSRGVGRAGSIGTG